MARPKKRDIVLSEWERRTLLELTRSGKAPHGLVRWAGIVLASADGDNSPIGARTVQNLRREKHCCNVYLVQF